MTTRSSRSGGKTSADYPLRIDWLDDGVQPPAAVGLTFAPGKKSYSTDGSYWDRDLDLDLAELSRAGVATIVSLLEDHELPANKIPDLYPRARAQGLEVLQLPITDKDIPDNVRAVQDLLEKIETRLAAGKKVVIHCLGGLGRTGTIAGCFLVSRRMSPGDALETLQRVRRSERCPETEPQRQFIRDFAKVCAPGRSTRTASPAEATTPAPPRPMSAGGWYPAVLTSLHASGQSHPPGVFGQLKHTLGQAEDFVSHAPQAAFAWDERGYATLHLPGRSYAAGRFDTPSIGELRARVQSRREGGSDCVRLSVLRGAHPLTDIGTLQATAPPGTLFQVASQFNCLEAPGSRIVPVREYVRDNTQGPRASISAFPGTLLRHYSAPAPDGTRFVQTDGRCINLLADVVPAEIAKVHSGYLQLQNVRRVDALAKVLTDNFDDLRVGAHDDVEVAYGHEWCGPVPNAPHQRIAQVFTSTIALGGYSSGGDSPPVAHIRRQLLRAAYLGTLLAALDLGKHSVVLTMIGGGVFGNPHEDIWDAIHWAVAEVDTLAGQPLDVYVNTREKVSADQRKKVQARGGTVVEFGTDGIVIGDDGTSGRG